MGGGQFGRRPLFLTFILMTELILEKNTLGNDVYRLDLKAKSLSKNFLGLAFDLHFTGKGQYQKFEFGEAFANLPPDQQPVYLIKSQQQSLIFGLTKNSDQVAKTTSTKGDLGSFYFQGDPGEMDFSNQVLSNYSKSERKDVPDAVWKVITLPQKASNTTAKSKAKTVAKSASKSSNKETLGTASWLGGNGSQADETWQKWQDNLWGWEGGIALGVIILVTVAVVVVKKFFPDWAKKFT